MSGARALHGVTARANEPRVVTAGLSRHQHAYLSDGLRKRAEIHSYDSFTDVEKLVSALEPFDVVVLAPVDRQGRDAVRTVELLVGAWPGAAIVIFCPSSAGNAPPLRSLVLAGAHQIVFEGVANTAATLATAIETARRESAAEQVLARLQPLVPPALHSLIHAVLANPAMTSVNAIAAQLGVHRKTLVNRSQRESFISPAELIAWTRLAMVGYQLEKSGMTIEAIAHQLEFPSHTSLRNLIKRYTGCTASQIREGAGLGAVIAALQARLRSDDRELPIT